MMTESEALARIWADYVAFMSAELQRGLTSLRREPDPQGDADLAALLAECDPM